MLAVPVFSPSHDLPLRSAESPTFEDSVVMSWYDLTAKVGGYLRICQHPSSKRQAICFGLFTGDGERFLIDYTNAPIGPGDRREGGMGWSGAIDLDLDRQCLTVNLRECEGQLRLTDFHPRYDYNPLTGLPGRPSKDAGHFAVAGRLTGQLCIRGRITDVDALGYRDRCWGNRQWNAMGSVRWWQAVFGPDLVVGMAAVVMPNGPASFGYAILDGVPHRLDRPELAIVLDQGVLAPRDGRALLNFGGKERGTMTHAPVDAMHLRLQDRMAAQSIGIARWENRQGMSNMEVME